MPDTLQLTAGDAITQELRDRKKTSQAEIVKGNSRETRQPRIDELILEGWKETRDGKTTTKLEKAKPSDQQLEDDLWVLMANLGFTKMSSGRNFKIRPDGTDRQVDILAADDDVAVVIECTQTQVKKKKGLTDLLEKVENWKKSAAIKGQLEKTLGTKKLPIAYIIATRNVEWSTEDLKRANEAGIKLIRDEQLDYFRELSRKLKHSAKYQFLGYAFQKASIPNLDCDVLATRFKTGSTTFYSCMVRGQELLRLTYINHKANAVKGAESAYQRMASPNRLRNIAKFVDDKSFTGCFPTNVVVNFHTKNNKPLKFEVAPTKITSPAGIGTLELPAEYGSAFIIDGQHRLFGYAHSDRAEVPDDKTTFLVLGYENLSDEEEGQMFIDINSKQQKVSKGLLNELEADIHKSSKNPKLKNRSVLSFTLQRLANNKKSKLFNRVQLIGKKKDLTCCMSLEQLMGPLQDQKFLGEQTKAGEQIPGPFSDSVKSGYDADCTKLSKALNLLFNAMVEHGPKQYELGKDSGGCLWMNVGIRPFFVVVKAVIEHLQWKNKDRYHEQDPTLFMPSVIEYLKPLIVEFENMDEKDTKTFRDRRAMAGVTWNAFEMMLIIQKAKPDFEPDGLKEHLAKVDVEGTDGASKLLRVAEKRLWSFVMHTLKNTYGEKKVGNDPKWWREGVPTTIRMECSERMVKEVNPQSHISNYVDFIKLRDIIQMKGQWELFKNVFQTDSPSGKRTGKASVDWILEVNELRKSPAHANRDLLTKDQVKRVQEIYDWIMDHVPAVGGEDGEDSQVAAE